MNDPELARLETALAGLAPSPAAIDRDALLFNAGRRSAARGRFWPCTAALFAVLAAGLGGALALRPGPQFTERVVFVPVPAATPEKVAAAPPAEGPPTAAQKLGAAAGRERLSAFALRQQALRWGVDGLPLASAGGPTLPAKGAPPNLSAVPSYYQMRLSLRTGGAL
jgi:hypothetical protein